MGNTGAMPDERVREILGLALERARCMPNDEQGLGDAAGAPIGVTLSELAQLAQHVVDLRSADNLNAASFKDLEAELAQCKTLLEQARTENHGLRLRVGAA